MFVALFMAKKMKHFRLSDEARTALKGEKERSGRSETQILEDLITGTREFGPQVESLIAKAVAETGLARAEVIRRCVNMSVGKVLELLPKDSAPKRRKNAKRK
jgi:hypothetical protein